MKLEKLKLGKKGLFSLGHGGANKMIEGFVLAIVAFNVAAVGLPLLFNATALIAAINAPFAALFNTDSVVPLIVMGNLILVTVAAFAVRSRRK